MELKQVKEALEDIVKLASKGIDNPVLLTIENEASDALVELERYQESRLRILENAVPGGVSDDALGDPHLTEATPDGEIETRADHDIALGAMQSTINNLIEEGRLLLEDAEEGHKRVIVCAARSCGCCVRLEACNSHTLICKKYRLLERRENGALFHVFNLSHEPEAYEGPSKIDGRGWGTELTPRRKG